MGKLKMLMGMFFLFVLLGIFSCCSSEDENLAVQNDEVALYTRSLKTSSESTECFLCIGMYEYRYIDVCFY